MLTKTQSQIDKEVFIAKSQANTSKRLVCWKDSASIEVAAVHSGKMLNMVFAAGWTYQDNSKNSSSEWRTVKAKEILGLYRAGKASVGQAISAGATVKDHAARLAACSNEADRNALGAALAERGIDAKDLFVATQSTIKARTNKANKAPTSATLVTVKRAEGGVAKVAKVIDLESRKPLSAGKAQAYADKITGLDSASIAKRSAKVAQAKAACKGRAYSKEEIAAMGDVSKIAPKIPAYWVKK
jgi:hypothetical protein